MNRWTMLGTLALTAALSVTGCERNTPAPTPPPAAPTTATVAAQGRVAVTVDGEGYHPATINAPAGAAVTLVFTRTTDETCGQQLVFPDQNIRRDLPLNTAVEVPLTVPASGRVRFTCGMNMYQGAVVVQ